jgi:hypothetical protein
MVIRMIIVSAGHDNVARVLDTYAAALAARLQNLVTARLSPPNSTVANVQSSLAANPDAPLCFFGHGTAPPGVGFIAHDNAAVGGDPATLGLLKNRAVFGACCYGGQVGAAAAGNGFSMVGYDGVYQVLTSAPYDREMENAAIAGAEHIANKMPAAQAAIAARKAYYRVARSWRRNGLPLGGFSAVVATMNATRVRAW